MRKIFTAFTLAEVLITLGIIGIVAEMTIPTLMQDTQERVAVVKLLKFNATLQQAVELWKQDIGCTEDAYSCLVPQGLPDQVCSDFDQISKFMRISQNIGFGTADWLPAQTLNYYGDAQTGPAGGVSNLSSGTCKYMLQDGTSFTMDVDPIGFSIYVDVNGKKPPNRMGKDTFPFMVGYGTGKDVDYRAYSGDAVRNTSGFCGLANGPCDANNANPTVGGGAYPTAYVIMKQKLPDFKALSTSVAGFKP